MNFLQKKVPDDSHGKERSHMHAAKPRPRPVQNGNMPPRQPERTPSQVGFQSGWRNIPRDLVNHMQSREQTVIVVNQDIIKDQLPETAVSREETLQKRGYFYTVPSKRGDKRKGAKAAIKRWLTRVDLIRSNHHLDYNQDPAYKPKRLTLKQMVS